MTGDVPPRSGGRASAWLRLGRVSNLPTVWSNTLAALALSGEMHGLVLVAALMTAMSLFYVAGMVLNDAFDANYDARHRPARPIPSGVVSRAAAFSVGFTGLAAGAVLVSVLAWAAGREVVPALGYACLLASAILAYDVYHKNNLLSPVIMGACRALVYVVAAGAVGERGVAPVVTVALLQWGYVVGLTYAAKQEDLVKPGSLWPVLLVVAAPLTVLMSLSPWGASLWPGAGGGPWLVGVAVAVMACSVGWGMSPLFRKRRQIGLAIGRLIAGIAVLDAMAISTTGWVLGVVIALGFAVVTRLTQRFIPGT